MKEANAGPVAEAGGWRTLADGFSVQCRVIGALVLRELHTRYGRENIGYLWMFAEPMMLATVISLLHIGSSTHYGSDIRPLPFTIIGYTIFIIFRGIFNRAEGSLEANASLLYHRTVTILDLQIARVIIEATGCFTTMCILLGFCILVGAADFPYRPLYLIGAVLLMIWWSFALSLMVVGCTYDNHTLGRLVHPISYFTIPVSGAFFEMDWFGPKLQAWLALNPMVAIFEQARYGQFRSASPEFINVGYVAAVTGVLTYWGLILIRRVRRRLRLN